MRSWRPRAGRERGEGERRVPDADGAPVSAAPGRVPVSQPPRSASPCLPLPALPRMETEIVSRDDISAALAAADSRSGQKTPRIETSLPVCDLPPLLLEPAEIECRPTIFLGIGGLAARTLQTLYQRIEARFGDPAALPALQFLLFETDAESLKTATDCGRAPMKNDSAILLPLRQSADYRRQSDGRFHWLSRRWIYNIPRNAQTQGLRPLGRLALVDNMERAIEQVTLARCVRRSIRRASWPRPRPPACLSAIRRRACSSSPRLQAVAAVAWYWTSATSSARCCANSIFRTTPSAACWPIARAATRRTANWPRRTHIPCWAN